MQDLLSDVAQDLRLLRGQIFGDDEDDDVVVIPPVVGGPFLPLTGGTMTGPLLLAADPTSALEAATKSYVDSFLPLTGGTLTGALTVSDGSLVSGGFGENEWGDLMGAARFCEIATTNGSPDIVAAGGVSQFVATDEGKIVREFNTSGTIPDDTRILTVVDATHATMTNAATATDASIVPQIGAFGGPLFAGDNDFTNHKLRSTGLMIGHHAHVPNGSGSTTAPYPSVAMQLTVDHWYDDNSNSTMDSFGQGPRGTFNVEGTVNFGPNMPVHDAAGGPFLNSALLYANYYGEDAAPGGLIVGPSLSPAVLAKNGSLAISTLAAYWSNVNMTSLAGGTLNVGEFKAYQTGDFIGEAGTTTVNRYVGMHFQPPNLNSGTPTVGQAVMVDIGQESLRSLTGLNHSSNSATVTSSSPQFVAEDKGAIFHMDGSAGGFWFIKTFNSTTSVTLNAPFPGAHTAVTGSVVQRFREPYTDSGVIRRIGLRNAMTTVWTPDLQTPGVTGTTLDPCAHHINVSCSVTGPTCTLANPNINNDPDEVEYGQVLEVYNIGPDSLVWTNGQGVSFSNTAGATLVQPGGSMTTWRFQSFGFTPSGWGDRWVLVNNGTGTGSSPFYTDGTTNVIPSSNTFGVVPLLGVAPYPSLILQHAPTTNSGQLQPAAGLGQILFQGSYNTTPDLLSGASITAFATQAFTGATKGGTQLLVATTPNDGSGVLRTAFTVDQDQHVYELRAPYHGSTVATTYEKMAGVTVPPFALDHWRTRPAARTTLDGSINASVTTLDVTNFEQFPAFDDFVIKISDEQMLVTGGAGTSTWTVVRGVNFTTAASHADGAPITTTGLMHVVCIGDSVVLGLGDFTTGPVDGFADQVRRTLGQPDLGIGYRGLWHTDEFARTTGGAAAWTFVDPGDPEDIGPFGYDSATLFATWSVITATGSTAICTWTPPDNVVVGQVDIHYFETASTTNNGSYSTDGGSTWHDLPTAPPASGARLQTFSVVTVSPATVKVRAATAGGTGAYFAYAGLTAYNQPVDFDTVGLVVHNFGQTSAFLHSIVDSARTDGLRFFTGDAASLRPSLVVAHCSNDVNFVDTLGAGPAIAQWETDVDALVTGVQAFGADVLWLSSYESDRSSVGVTPANQASYRASIDDLSISLGFAQINLYEAWDALLGTAGYSAANSAGMMEDIVHPTQKGHDDIASRVNRVLATDGGIPHRIERNSSPSFTGLTVTPNIVSGFAPVFHYGIGGCPSWLMTRINGTATDPTAITNAQLISYLAFAGQYDATVGNTKFGAVISTTSTAAWSSATVGGAKLTFQTMPNSGAGPLTALTLDQDQSAAFADDVSVAGDLAVSGAITGALSLTDLTVTPTLTGGFAPIFLYGIAGIPSLLTTRINGTVGSPTAVTSGQIVSDVVAAGQYDTTVGHTKWGSAITTTATATWSASTTGGAKLIFQTLPNSGSSVPLTALTLDQDQTATFASTVTATGLTLSATPLAIASGGTGASSAASALTALGAAPTASPTFTGTVSHANWSIGSGGAATFGSLISTISVTTATLAIGTGSPMTVSTAGTLSTTGNLATTGSGTLSIAGTSTLTGVATFAAIPVVNVSGATGLTTVRDAGAAVATATTLSTLLFRGAVDASNTLASGAAIVVTTEETFASGHAGSRIALQTTPIGSTTLATRFGADNAGLVFAGTNAARMFIVDSTNGSIGFFGTAVQTQRTSGANLTNNVTSGGTDDTIANFTDLTTYSNSAAAIRNDIYQLARKLKQINDGLRTYGLFT